MQTQPPVTAMANTQHLNVSSQQQDIQSMSIKGKNIDLLFGKGGIANLKEIRQKVSNSKKNDDIGAKVH